MQFCSGGPYGVSDMQQLVLAAASHHNMFSDAPPHHHHHHHHHHQQQQLHHQHQQYYQQSLQQHELMEFYQRQQAAVLQEQEVQGTHMNLFGLPHHQQLQQKAPSLQDASTTSFHLPNFSQHMNLGSESASLQAPITKVASHPSSGQDPVHYYTKAGAGEDSIADLGAAVDSADKAGLSGSRWPREETLALLRIRSEMDPVFRDSASKGPLWDEVSRKLQDAGFQRSSKKCKEKFENVHKYYKKTKDGKAEKQDGKTYRFHTELEAIYASNQEDDGELGGVSTTMDGVGGGSLMFSNMGSSALQQMDGNGTGPLQETSAGPNSPSSISCGDAVEQQMCSRKRKRSSSTNWRTMRAFFEDLATQLMERQDALHKKFLEAIEKREEERERREEAYKRLEMARISRDHDLRAREQAMAASRDAALVAFLQKVTGETLHLPEMATRSMKTGAEIAVAVAATAGEGASTPSTDQEPADCNTRELGAMDANSRRWPKVEVLALIRIRSSLELRFQETGPKAQLWEEVSSAMAALGLSRSGKRCKEKWENINKYYRKTKDNVGRKLRPESASKTCPYFQELELLYERGILASPANSNVVIKAGAYSNCARLDGSQTSGELPESSSRDETSQQTFEAGSGNPDLYPPVSSIPNVRVPSSAMNLRTTILADGVRGTVVDHMQARCSTTCSSSRTEPLPLHISSGVADQIQDMDTPGSKMNVKADQAAPAASYLLRCADQINVNCHPFSSGDRSISPDQGQQLLPREESMSNSSAGPGLLAGVSSGSHFVREMMVIQQQQHLYEGHQLENEQFGATGTEMVLHNAGPDNIEEQQDVDQMQKRMQRQAASEEERSRANSAAGHHVDSATLMALVHKLATGGGGGGGACSSEFDLSSPASSSGGQV